MSESENSGGQFMQLQKEGESDVHTAKPTDVSEGNQGSSEGGAEFREDQRQQTTGTSGTETWSGQNAYPLPSEQGDREREAAAQKEEDSSQQQSSADSGSGGEQQQESSGEQKQEEQSSSGGDSEKKDDDDEAKGNEKKGTKPGAQRENPDSIPTAGGERLGEKHWGESKMVPDVPKTAKEQEQENVSSAEGQPDQQTKDNTAKNTGDSSGHGEGGEEGEQKPGMVEKIKDKLGLAGK